jgi:hypothetical protein
VLTSSVYALHGLFSGVLDKTVVDICEARAHIPGGLIGFIFSSSLQSIGVSLPLSSAFALL